ncbi:MAG: hypothetical protein ABI614_16065, partial [Planctomycetota bacterium]
QFRDDPNSFPGPPTNSSNTAVILVVIAVVCGMMMLICGGVIFGIVMTVRQAQQDIDVVMDEPQWQPKPDQTPYQKYKRLVAEGRYGEARDQLNSDLESNPNSAVFHNNKAWLLATCPDDTVRDGKLAVEHAARACELTAWNNFAYVDTLAAAYAESGDFESAVKWQEQAIRLGGGKYAEDLQKRLRLFKANKPYRQGVPPYKDMLDEQSTTEQPSAEPSSAEQPSETEGTAVPDVEVEATTTATEQSNQ